MSRRSQRSISRQTTTSWRSSPRKLNEEFKTFGFELTKFVIENISLPQEVEAAMDKRTSMGVIGDVGRYAQFQAADAMRDAAQNPGGGAGTGVGLGARFAIGNAMAGAMSDAMKSIRRKAAERAATPGLQQAYHVRKCGHQNAPARSSVWSAVRSKGSHLRELPGGIERPARNSATSAVKRFKILEGAVDAG